MNGDEIALILERILLMQRSSVREELDDRFCDRGFLGDVIAEEGFNTRPVVIFTDDDKPWVCPIEREITGCFRDECCDTCVFRVERVSNGVVTLRALRESCSRNSCRRFESTNSFITIRLSNIAALRCLRDTFVNLCIN